MTSRGALKGRSEAGSRDLLRHFLAQPVNSLVFWPHQAAFDLALSRNLVPGRYRQHEIVGAIIIESQR